MSVVVYRYEHNKQFKKNNIGYTYKKSIIDGGKGLTFSFVKKEDNTFYRINVREISKDKFNVKEKKNDVESNTDKTMSELKKIISDNKDLVFVKDYLEKERSLYMKDEQSGTVEKKSSKKLVGGEKKSDKTAKKTSKKASKKSSRKTSKKPSKKSSRKTSKKASRRK
jgi:hypothetical protein